MKNVGRYTNKSMVLNIIKSTSDLGLRSTYHFEISDGKLNENNESEFMP